MCLLLVKPKDKVLKKDEMKKAHTTNGDGCGLAFAKDGQIYIDKGLMDFDSFWKLLEEHMDKTLIVHYRLQTHGGKSDATCHPFSMCNGSIVFAHNGIISDMKTSVGISDTMAFGSIVEEAIKNDPKLIHNEAIQYLISKAIGTSNKMAFIDTEGEVVIINKQQGNEDGGIWYSNYGYKCYTQPFNNGPYNLRGAWQGGNWNGRSNMTDEWRDARREWFPQINLPSQGPVEKESNETAIAVLEKDDEYEDEIDKKKLETDPESDSMFDTETISDAEIDRYWEKHVRDSKLDQFTEKDIARAGCINEWRALANAFFSSIIIGVLQKFTPSVTKVSNVKCSCCGYDILEPQTIWWRSDWNKYCCEECSLLADANN